MPKDADISSSTYKEEPDDEAAIPHIDKTLQGSITEEGRRRKEKE